VDEACSWVGLARSFVEEDRLGAMLEFFQHRLYNCSSYLATPPGVDSAVEPPGEADVKSLEDAIDEFELQAGPIGCFVLPGGSRAAGMLHVARTVCRRAERDVVTLGAKEPVDRSITMFLNRGSDFLFAAARLANHLEGRGDVAWDDSLGFPGA
jgi:cob(I)alamin adenosyltransferase